MRNKNNKKIIIIFFICILSLFFIKTAKFFPILAQLFFNKEIQLKKSDGSINVLLLGVGGGTHDGPDLTDTIIYANINPTKNRATLVSIPRDMWIPDISEKINTAYAIGNSKQKNGGLILTKAVVSKIINRSVDYAIVVDFAGFVKAVDLIGGLDIDVERSFDDYEYPIEKERENLCGHSLDEATALIATQEATIVFPCRYEHIHFGKGLTHMDGEQALKFVRSRYAIGEEGTDFARSRRQQKVISTFKDKIFSLETILNPIKIASLYGVVADNIHTDIPTSEIDDFVKLGQKMKGSKIESTVIDIEDKEKGKKGLLVNPPLEDFDGKWVLIPRIGKDRFSEIHTYVDCVLTSGITCPIK